MQPTKKMNETQPTPPQGGAKGGSKKVVVAFSGGLDTSYTVMKLAQDGYEVHAACANTGGFSAEQLKKNEENAYKLGAVKYVTQQLLPHFRFVGTHFPGHRHRSLCERDRR